MADNSAADAGTTTAVDEPMQILDTVHDGVYFVDVGADEIIEVNQSACDLLEYSRDELLSLSVSDIHPDEMDRLREFAASVDEDGEAMASDLHCMRKDGRRIPIEASACRANLWDESGLLVIVRDVSSVKRQNHYLKVFDRVLRHNLRNRMNVVLGRAEYIERNVEDERLLEQSQLLCRTVDELVDVVNDIRIVQQSLRTEVDASVSVDCGVLLPRIVDEMDTTHDTATLSVDIQESLSVRADDRLSIALEHIVENAVVHNDDSADVKIVATPVDEHERVEIQVIDDGPGIPPSERLVATNPGETSPLEHGTGLGLWVASMIVRTLGGDLTIEDNDPDGSIVTLRLPRANRAARVS